MATPTKAELQERATIIMKNPTTVSHLQDLSFEEACAVLDAQDAMQICDENHAVQKGSPSKINVEDSGVSPSPTRKRADSSISMSDVPSYMCSGQILPAEGLHAASPVGACTMTALEFLGTPRQSESFSDLEDHALGFACETSGSTVSQSSSKGKRKMDNRDEDEGPVVSFGGVGRGNGKVKVNEGDDVSSSSGSSESSESSDEELPGAGGVSIYEDMASVAFGVRPVAVEKDRRVKTGIPFPKYNNALAMRLLELPEVPLEVLMPFAAPDGTIIGGGEGWTVVDHCGELMKLPVRQRSRRV